MSSRKRSATVHSLIDFDVQLDPGAAVRECGGMPSWSEFEAAAPELAARVLERLDAHRHKTLATIRRDGSPRISGTEAGVVDGELWIGSMWQARKAQDLRRDPRFALHSGSDEPSSWRGDAKLAGVAEEITDPELVKARNGAAAGNGPSHLFRLDLREVSTVGLDEGRKHIVIDVWTPEKGVRTMKRA
jgi:Pyridoxamine 5'-phosphate oxidase